MMSWCCLCSRLGASTMLVSMSTHVTTTWKNFTCLISRESLIQCHHPVFCMDIHDELCASSYKRATQNELQRHSKGMIEPFSLKFFSFRFSVLPLPWARVVEQKSIHEYIPLQLHGWLSIVYPSVIHSVDSFVACSELSSTRLWN